MKKQVKKTSIILVLVLIISSFTLVKSKANSDLEYDESTNTCIVYPTGSDDTDNIQEAFNLVTANGAGQVKLEPGEFVIDREIVVINFDGMFDGSGMEETVICTTSRDDWPHREEEYFPEVASLFLFYQTDMEERSIKVSDMSVKVKATTYDYGGFFGLNVFDIYGCVDGEFTDDKTPLNTMLKRVRISGYIAHDFPFVNTVNPWQVGGQAHVDEDNNWSFEPITGRQSVIFCKFDTVGGGPKYNSVNGNINIKYNTIRNAVVGTWLFFSNQDDGPLREIKYNIISGSIWMGIGVWGSNDFEIANNYIINCDTGIDMWGSDNIDINSNFCMCNRMDMAWDQSGDNTITDNYYSTKSWE